MADTFQHACLGTPWRFMPEAPSMVKVVAYQRRQEARKAIRCLDAPHWA